MRKLLLTLILSVALELPYAAWAGPFDNSLWLGTDNVSTRPVLNTDRTGNELRRVNDTEASGIAIDLTGNRIYFGVATGGEITGRDLNDPATPLVTLNPVTNFGEDMAFDGTFLWRADLNAGVVLKIDLGNGNVIFSFDPGFSPLGIAWDGSNLWVSQYAVDGLVEQFTTAGVATGNQFQAPLGGTLAGGLAFDTTDSTLWIGTVGQVFHSTTTGTLLGSFNVPVSDDRFVDGLEFQGVSIPLLDHFLCYKARPAKDSPRFVPRTVALADQFDTTARNFDVTRPLSLCPPADKRGEGITDSNTHLKGYRIRLTRTDPPQPSNVKHAVRVTNQFGELLLDTLRPDRLLVPTAKSLAGPVDPPGPNNVDHYKCYKVRRSKGAPRFQPILGVSVSDQFINQPPKLFDLKRPTRLCNPVDKNGEGIKNPATHLLCYQAKPAKGQPRHQPISPIFVNNQFGPEILKTVKEEDLCVPSTKTVLGTLGPVSDVEDSDNEDDLEGLCCINQQ